MQIYNCLWFDHMFLPCFGLLLHIMPCFRPQLFKGFLSQSFAAFVWQDLGYWQRRHALGCFIHLSVTVHQFSGHQNASRMFTPSVRQGSYTQTVHHVGRWESRRPFFVPHTVTQFMLKICVGLSENCGKASKNGWIIIMIRLIIFLFVAIWWCGIFFI